VESESDAVTVAPRDNNAFRFPVSVKGVLIRSGKVILVRNDRDEWELPGGKLELSETPLDCVAREIMEELGLEVAPQRIVDSWTYTIAPGVHVLVITYGCTESTPREAVLSDENKELGWFDIDQIDRLRLPDGYKTSIRAWASLLKQ
jgi:8-oxo-dGTP pyrophosphatase MutT (NUDIX family)